MFPFPLPLWETDATARAAVEQSVAANVTDVGSGALLSGVEGSFETLARASRAEYGLELAGAYARATYVSIGAGASAPSDSASASLEGRASWETSPRTTLSFGSAGYLATRLGVRADDALAQRDPFLFGSRLQYTIGAGPGLGVVTSRRSHLGLSARYEQTGALTAEDPRAVGIDTHQGSVGLRYDHELSDVDTIGPVLEYSFTHFYNALLDVDLTRGPADVHAGTALMAVTHAFGRRTTLSAGAGLTAASPPPIVISRSRTPVIAPAARAGLGYEAGRYELSLEYTYQYTSLGARIGYGQEHDAVAELSLRPLRGGAYRDVVLTGVARLAVGSAPVAASPPLAIPGQPAPSQASLEGTLSTITAAAGAQLSYPLTLGLMLFGGVDLEFVRARFDPPPTAGSSTGALRTIWTVGLAGTLSTDRRALLPEPDDEAPRGAPAEDPR